MHTSFPKALFSRPRQSPKRVHHSSDNIQDTEVRSNVNGGSVPQSVGKAVGKGAAARFNTDHRRNDRTRYFIPPESSCVPFSFPAHATHALRTGRSHSFAGQLAGLLHPTGELSFVELVVLVDFEVYEADLQLVDGDNITDACAAHSTSCCDCVPVPLPWHMRGLEPRLANMVKP